ncbi:MAG: transcriptional repressor [Sedimentisphaerales bacterium]|nr:transcriptional repressor [Sedimentisphaerales bacterium]
MTTKSSLQPEELLQNADLRCTRGRLDILRVLLAADRPLSQDEIARRMGRNGLNKVTIYRALEAFNRAGFLHIAQVQERIRYYELAHRCRQMRCHPHFACVRCGRLYCLHDHYLPLIKDLDQGFVIHRQQIRLEGLCPDCSG